ncbi:MAG TPA: hypothetical protein PKL17_07450 [Pseudomonadota bacterium]|jgi:hypothetical protein|nr:hypothetical protein [Pseudomonadota bacterium]HNI58911.1 hypothetical protein [Pseudomonadota bacterium]HNK44600.1 hypothetical protein [Pseudomonadota bacterium]HNN51792.1 hypothetical protein [Pseudomonadota bacterium]
MNPSEHQTPCDPPPILKSWGRLYVLTLGMLFLSVLLLFVLGKVFS